MNKLFRPKCLRRVVLFLLIVFPIFYMFAGLIFSLNGSHGAVDLSAEFSTGVTWWDRLFSAPFADDNFISDLGRSVLNGNAVGFTPVADLLSWIDVNVFGFGVSDSLAVFVYGYAYYTINIIVIYEIVVLVVKLLLMPLKVVELFDKGVD